MSYYFPTILLLVIVSFIIYKGECCTDTPAIIVACGNAFGPCTSNGPVQQLQAVVKGLPSIEFYPVTWGGVKWNYSLATGVKYLEKVKCSATKPVLYAGQSAGAWLASLIGVLAPNAVDGIISFYGPLDLPTLWQKDEWGKTNSPRGPILYAFPWGYPGCDNCNDPFPQGDSWFWNTTNEQDPRNYPLLNQAMVASAYHYFNASTPPTFATQGLDDGIIGQYGGVTQARRMLYKYGALRAGDYLQEIPGYAHGYQFNDPATTQVLRNWIIQTLKLKV